MSKRGVLGGMLLMSIFIFSGCSGNRKENMDYIKQKEGYVVKQFDGNAKQITVTIEEYNGEPVIGIQEFALANEDYLEEIYIGQNVKEISPWSMANCRNLKRIEVHPDNPYYTSLDGVLYSKDLKTLWVYPNQNRSASYEIPEGVTHIHENAFYKNTQLEQVKLPSTLEVIEDRAFQRCINLQSIELPNGLTYIGRDSFAHCSKLEKLVVPNTVETVEEYAFFGCEGVEIVFEE